MSTTVSALGARFPYADLAVGRLRGVRGELEFDAEVAPGVTVTWDPATPGRCVAVSAGTGPAAARTHRGDILDRTPWLRLAALATLDHRLHLPLDRALLDAEIAVAQVRAARTLARTEATRDHLVGRALMRARSAAGGLVASLERWTAVGRRPPAPLDAALTTLAHGFAVLAAEVDGHDGALTAVIEALDRVAGGTPVRVRGRRRGTPPPPVPSGVAQIDPRALPARLVQLGPAVDSAEIEAVPLRLADRPALQVRVPAFESLRWSLDLPDLAVRLIHRRSGRPHGYGLLGFSDRTGDPCFATVVSLTGGARADDVRVEVYDARHEPPLTTDGAGLRRARRATLFLAGWRSLLADTRLRGVSAAPAARLRAVVRTLAPDSDGPLWTGGPAVSHLMQIVGLGDHALAAMLRGEPGAPRAVAGHEDAAAAVLASVAGPGDLLAAELAAAYERAVPV